MSDYPFSNLDDFLECYKQLHNKTIYEVNNFCPNYIHYLLYDAFLNEDFEDFEIYDNLYNNKITTLYHYEIDTLEYINAIKTMCYLDTIGIKIDWDKFFEGKFEEFPIENFNNIKLFQDLIEDNNDIDIIEFISTYVSCIYNDKINYNISLENKYFDVIFLGMIKCFINNNSIFDMDKFFQPLEFNKYADLSSINNYYNFNMRLKGMIIDYITFDNNISIVNIKSDIVDDFIDNEQKFINEINIHLVKEVSKIVIDYSFIDVKDIVQLYGKKLGGWEYIKALKNDGKRNWNKVKPPMDLLIMMRRLKYNCYYLRKNYPNYYDEK